MVPKCRHGTGDDKLRVLRYIQWRPRVPPREQDKANTQQRADTGEAVGSRDQYVDGRAGFIAFAQMTAFTYQLLGAFCNQR